ncbi:hypothetical protein AGMMS4957_18430 [Bacteroidia bacterium]|nr:hypothetical protein AGMMS4957_18430 [Bacteroidia bacterium]
MLHNDMKLIDLIVDVLSNSSHPLLQSEILEAAENHKNYTNCQELQRVQVKSSAVARCLSKYSEFYVNIQIKS